MRNIKFNVKVTGVCHWRVIIVCSRICIMASIVAVVCCLCSMDLRSGASCKKRKKLHGSSGQRTKCILEEVAVTKFQVMNLV